MDGCNTQGRHLTGREIRETQHKPTLCFSEPSDGTRKRGQLGPAWPWSATATALLTLLLAQACGEEASESHQGPQQLALRPVLLDGTIVAGGELQFHVEGAELIVPGAARVRLDGQLDGGDFDHTFNASFAETDQLLVTVSWNDLGLFVPSGDGIFEGNIKVVIDDKLSALRGTGDIDNALLEIVSSLEPRVVLSGNVDVYLNDIVHFGARGLLRPSEGTTGLELTGRFRADSGVSRDIEELLPVSLGEGRHDAVVGFPPGLFGIEPGGFQGSATAINLHTLGGEVRSSREDVQITLHPTVIQGFDPPSASRGQIVRMEGKGFIPPDTAASRSMFVLVEGDFFATTGAVLPLTGDTALHLSPERIHTHQSADLILRTEVIAQPSGLRELTGLAAMPGVMRGTMTPVIVDQFSTVTGTPWSGEFQIRPTRQFVFIKFLPGFGESLVDFGLRNVEPEIRARILAVVARDYDGFNIVFSDARPTDFAEYSIIEVGGKDPNGAGLLGLDNTAGKDTGNIRLDDVVGGENADSGELGYFVYGGVFIDSFKVFSPSLATEGNLGSPFFDQLFSPFMSELGGSAVEATEYPSGPRSEEIAEAIRVMGNLIGNTLSHEIGHSLGLAYFPEDLEGESELFHNVDDRANALMDAGTARPFEERAEVGGMGPQVFNEQNRDYLRSILGLP